MADFNQPNLTSLYSDMVDTLKNRDTDAIKWLDGTSSSNLPSGAKRWNTLNNYFEKYDGSTWSALTTNYNIDVDKVNGCSVNDTGTNTTDLWTANKISNMLNTKLNTNTVTGSWLLATLKTVDTAAGGLAAATAKKFATPTNISLTGGVTGTASYDGSTNISISTTVTDNSHKHTISDITNLQNTLNSKLSSIPAATASTLGGIKVNYVGGTLYITTV